MENSKMARTFLGLNASFSLLTGLALLMLAGTAAEQFFAAQADWQTITLRILAVGLIIFGIDLTLMATNRFVTSGQVNLISAMDVGWIVGSAVLIFMAAHIFTNTGVAVIVAVAAFVAIFAIGQYIGALGIRPPLSDASVEIDQGKIQARVSRTVDAPHDVVWQVMNDHPGYADVADNLSKVEVVSGDGLGMQRRCYGPKGENWLETCDIYNDDEAFGFRVHTEADDYPYPISDLRGKWSVQREGDGARFAIDIEAETKGSFFTKAMFNLAARRQFKAVLADLADAWADRMEREART